MPAPAEASYIFAVDVSSLRQCLLLAAACGRPASRSRPASACGRSSAAAGMDRSALPRHGGIMGWRFVVPWEYARAAGPPAAGVDRQTPSRDEDAYSYAHDPVSHPESCPAAMSRMQRARGRVGPHVAKLQFSPNSSRAQLANSVRGRVVTLRQRPAERLSLVNIALISRPIQEQAH